jgi:hypothetical protein
MNIQESPGNRPASVRVEFDGSLPLTQPQPGLKRGCAGYERAARYRALGFGALEACRAAGYEKITSANARKLVNRPIVRARVAHLVKDEEAVLREQRAVIMERLTAAAFGRILDFAIIDPETKQIVAIDWQAVKDSDLGVTIESFSFDRETGRLVKFERDNALNAVAQLRRMQGLDKPTKMTVTETDLDGKPITNADRARALLALLTEIRIEGGAAGGAAAGASNGGNAEG